MLIIHMLYFYSQKTSSRVVNHRDWGEKERKRGGEKIGRSTHFYKVQDFLSLASGQFFLHRLPQGGNIYSVCFFGFPQFLLSILK